MKVELKDTKISIEDIDLGQCFKYNAFVYMRVTFIESVNTNKFNCVSLQTGTLYYIDQLVQPCNLKVVNV